MSAKPIFIGGTASHAGKSWMATALCAWLRQRGFRVAPFKAQNMSNNSHVCRDGSEIGRAQVVQAEACGLEPAVDMNPILLKPNSALGSQLVLNGKVWRNLGAREYAEHFDFLLQHVLSAYARLAGQYEYIVIEGAGSVAELNLKDRDLVNLGLARRLNAPALLVGDIDRGGVFAQIAGTFSLLEPEERALMRSFAVNRFYGVPALFEDGVRILESLTGKPCLGVFPMLRDVTIDAEDAVSLDDPLPTAGNGPRTAILRLPHISNFTDFRLLAPFTDWADRPIDKRFEFVILPGTKSTLADLAWLRARGLDAWIAEQHRQGAAIIGICGGYQMMGESIADPHGLESPAATAEGLGLLPVRTVLMPEKTTRLVDAATPGGVRFAAYEIHMGRTERPREAQPFAVLSDGTPEGIRLGRCTGTYLHGALENAATLSELFGRTIPPAAPKQYAYQRLAEWFDENSRGFEELYL